MAPVFFIISVSKIHITTLLSKVNSVTPADTIMGIINTMAMVGMKILLLNAPQRASLEARFVVFSCIFFDINKETIGPPKIPMVMTNMINTNSVPLALSKSKLDDFSAISVAMSSYATDPATDNLHQDQAIPKRAAKPKNPMTIEMEGTMENMADALITSYNCFFVYPFSIALAHDNLNEIAIKDSTNKIPLITIA